MRRVFRVKMMRQSLEENLPVASYSTTTTTSSSSTNPIDDDPSTIRGTADHGARPGSLSPPAAKAEKTAGDESSSSSSSSSTPTTPVQASAPPATAAAANEHAASTATTRNSRMKALEGKYYNYSKELMKGKRAAAAAPRTTVTRAVATGITRKSRDEPSSTTPPSPQNCGAATSFQIKAAFKISEAEATSRVDKVEATDSNPLFLSRSPPQTTQNKQSKHPTSKKRIIKGHRRDAFSNMLAEAANQGQAAGKDHFLQRLKSCN
mmetsp:Transcript_8559/g.13830  ORF Transcript_8559/g.13830 Transcript_8559/m.13830 type:complete len:264 (-) Transcript_8559:65-856(-)